MQHIKFTLSEKAFIQQMQSDGYIMRRHHGNQKLGRCLEWYDPETDSFCFSFHSEKTTTVHIPL